MRILITNDDGFNADGIKSLKKIALEMSTNENIFVVAPSENQSAKEFLQANTSTLAPENLLRRCTAVSTWE